MKVTFPLSLKVTLWLGLNLAVLVAAAALFVGARYGVGWDALVSGPAGERVSQLENLLSSELRANPAQSLDALLARYAPGRTELFVFRNDGALVGGRTVELPAVVRRELAPGGRPRPPARLPPGSAHFDRRLLAPPRPEDRPDPRRGAPPPPPPPQEDHLDRPAAPPPPASNGGAPLRFLRRAGQPPAYWIGLRMPLHRPDGLAPDRGTLIIRVPSLLEMLRLLDFGPWLIAVAIAFLLSVLCWLPFVGRLRRALLAITRATDRIAAGHFDTRLPSGRRDELGSLGHAVNQMAGQLETHRQTQKRFLGDVAHELGTPLGRLQVALELLERDSGPALQRQLADVREEVQQVTHLVNELLAFTKADLRSPRAALAAVDLAALTTRVLAREDATARIAVDVPAHLRALADAPLLERALGNLVRNALRYAPGTPVALTVRLAAGGDVLMDLTDEGPGVPAAALDRLGEPFFRPDVARARETGGTGLGLAIVRSCIEACGGSLAFRNRAPHGFIAEIRLAPAND